MMNRMCLVAAVGVVLATSASAQEKDHAAVLFTVSRSLNTEFKSAFGNNLFEQQPLKSKFNPGGELRVNFTRHLWGFGGFQTLDFRSLSETTNLTDRAGQVFAGYTLRSGGNAKVLIGGAGINLARGRKVIPYVRGGYGIALGSRDFVYETFVDPSYQDSFKFLPVREESFGHQWRRRQPRKYSYFNVDVGVNYLAGGASVQVAFGPRF